MLNSEINIIGLCSFVNLRNRNKEIIPPALIIPRAEKPNVAEEDVHIPFIAFDSRYTYCDAPDFTRVNQSGFFSRRITDSVEITFAEAVDGTPRMLPSFRTIPSTDEFWPRAKSAPWNHDYVPQRGRLPRPERVAALVRLGRGDLSADRLSPIFWTFFDKRANHELTDRFASLATYSFPLPASSLTVRLTTFGTRKRASEELTFTPTDKASSAVAIWIGSCGPSYFEDALTGKEPLSYHTGTHFAILHRKKRAEDGPVPEPNVTGALAGRSHPGVRRVARDESGRWVETDAAASDNGRGDSGMCGPENGGGTP